jgi:hypothetical protein
MEEHEYLISIEEGLKNYRIEKLLTLYIKFRMISMWNKDFC